MHQTSAAPLIGKPRIRPRPEPRPQEMITARRVQDRLRPRCLPRVDSLDYAACCLPGRAVGGDFYDFLEPDPGRLAIVLGDISGKGVPAALMMATLQATLRSYYALSVSGLQQRIESVNRQFFDCTASAHYASLFVGEYDDASRLLRYANCGHVPPLLVRDDLSVERLRPTATVLGLFDQWTGSVGEVILAPGDTLVLVTDGIIEATDGAGEEYGEARLVDAVKRYRHLPPATLIRAIAREVRSFSGNRAVDDQTLVVARVHPHTRRSNLVDDTSNEDDGAR